MNFRKGAILTLCVGSKDGFVGNHSPVHSGLEARYLTVAIDDRQDPVLRFSLLVSRKSARVPVPAAMAGIEQIDRRALDIAVSSVHF